jgi:hypothetical protein
MSRADDIFRTKGLQVRSRISMISYLFEFLRIDEESLASLDPELIRECAKTGPKKETLYYLGEGVKWIKSSGI